MSHRKSRRPRLTVRSAAEMLGRPKDQVAQQLYDQKYPEEGERVFRRPFYQPGLRGIRGYFKAGRSELLKSRSEIQGLRQPARRDQNNRVLDSFEQSAIARRHLKPIPNRRYYAQVGNVELRLSPDMQVLEDGTIRVIYFNCKKAQYSPETARKLVEIAYWVLLQNGVNIQPRQVEFVDLFNGAVYTVDEFRAKTLEALNAEALDVSRMWDGL